MIRRRAVIIAAALLVLLAAAHTGLWWVVTGRILAGLPVFTAQAAREGWVLQAGAPTRAGWPLAAAVRVPDLVATRQLGGTRVVWTVQHLDLSIHPQDPATLLVVPATESTLQLGEARPLPIRAASAALKVPLDGRGPSTITAHDLVLGTPAAGVSVAALEAKVDLGVIAGHAGPIMVAPAFAAPFDQGATFTGRLVATPPIPMAETPEQSARNWQRAGGRAEMPELLLQWGPLQVAGTVAGGLDAQLQPAGEAHLRVQGALEVLDAASRAGVVAPGPASAARAVLGLLSLAARGGPLALPVTLRDRTLTVAQFALLRVPLLQWDAP